MTADIREAMQLALEIIEQAKSYGITSAYNASAAAALRAALEPVPCDIEEAEEYGKFLDWFCRNYPPHTVIVDPNWHAPRIWQRVPIQAAPPDDLLAALKRLVSILSPEIHGSDGSALEQARAAIARHS